MSRLFKIATVLIGTTRSLIDKIEFEIEFEFEFVRERRVRWGRAPCGGVRECIREQSNKQECARHATPRNARAHVLSGRTYEQKAQHLRRVRRQEAGGRNSGHTRASAPLTTRTRVVPVARTRAEVTNYRRALRRHSSRCRHSQSHPSHSADSELRTRTGTRMGRQREQSRRKF